jgi:hypothetical protein
VCNIHSPSAVTKKSSCCPPVKAVYGRIQLACDRETAKPDCILYTETTPVSKLLLGHPQGRPELESRIPVDRVLNSPTLPANSTGQFHTISGEILKEQLECLLGLFFLCQRLETHLRFTVAAITLVRRIIASVSYRRQLIIRAKSCGTESLLRTAPDNGVTAKVVVSTEVDSILGG